METQQQDTAPLASPIVTLPNNITIRAYHSSDAASLSLHANNAAVWNNLRNRFPHPYFESHSLDWISHANDPTNFIASGPWNPSTAANSNRAEIVGSGPKITTQYAIVVDGNAVGSIGLDFPSASEVYARSAELGYWLGEAYWGRGIMGAVAKAFVAWTWRTFGVLVRLNAEVNGENVGSRIVLERAGFVVEGRREKAVWKNGALRDVVLLGMVRPGIEGAGEDGGGV